MPLDVETILVSMLGSLIGLAGGIIIAFMYIRNQNLSDRRRRLNEQIQKTYIEQGILSMQEALSGYGVNAVFGINDLRISSVRAFKLGEGKESLNVKIKEIRARPTIADLTQRKFTFAIESFSYIRRFGIQVYGSLVRTLQLYSNLLSDILTYEVVLKNIDGAGIDEFDRSASVVAQMIQATQLYLQSRLDNLKDFIWQKDFENYTEFLSMLHEEKYKNFISGFEQYSKLLTDWMDSLTSPSPEARKNTSLALSKWLTENTDRNPLE
jgi:hypothetical protein